MIAVGITEDECERDLVRAYKFEFQVSQLAAQMQQLVVQQAQLQQQQQQQLQQQPQQLETGRRPDLRRRMCCNDKFWSCTVIGALGC